MSFLKPATPDPTALGEPGKAAAATPPPVMAPQGSKPNKKTAQASFLGTADIANPSGQSGNTMGKTLLGA